MSWPSRTGFYILGDMYRVYTERMVRVPVESILVRKECEMLFATTGTFVTRLRFEALYHRFQCDNKLTPGPGDRVVGDWQPWVMRQFHGVDSMLRPSDSLWRCIPRHGGVRARKTHSLNRDPSWSVGELRQRFPLPGVVAYALVIDDLREATKRRKRLAPGSTSVARQLFSPWRDLRPLGAFSIDSFESLCSVQPKPAESRAGSLRWIYPLQPTNERVPSR